MLGAATGASLGAAWVGGLMKGQGGLDSALLGGFGGGGRRGRCCTRR